MVLRRRESTLRSAQVNSFLDYLCRMIQPPREPPLAVAERTRCAAVTGGTNGARGVAVYHRFSRRNSLCR